LAAAILGLALGFPQIPAWYHVCRTPVPTLWARIRGYLKL
jgi:hypothetical protein